MKKAKKVFLSVAMGTFLLSSIGGTTTFAQDIMEEETAILTEQGYERIPDEDVEIVLDELGVSQEELTEQEEFSLLSRASGSVWNSTYTNQYNVKNSLSMSASLLNSGNLPYTTITVTNTGSRPITAIAYKGAIAGSSTLCSMTIPAGSSRAMTVTKNHVIRNGTINGQGTTSYLTYTVSLYNINGGAISCRANAVRYY